MGTLTDTAGRPGGRDDRLLAWPAVRDITGLSRTTAWRMQKTGDFPLPVLVSPGRVGWWESELATWKVTRAPRRPAETRPFGSASGRPASAPLLEGVVDDTGDGTVPVGPPASQSSTEVAFDAAPPRRPRRRATEISPGQIAFDFET